MDAGRNWFWKPSNEQDSPFPANPLQTKFNTTLANVVDWPPFLAGFLIKIASTIFLFQSAAAAAVVSILIPDNLLHQFCRQLRWAEMISAGFYFQTFRQFPLLSSYDDLILCLYSSSEQTMDWNQSTIHCSDNIEHNSSQLKELGNSKIVTLFHDTKWNIFRYWKLFLLWQYAISFWKSFKMLMEIECLSSIEIYTENIYGG